MELEQRFLAAHGGTMPVQIFPDGNCSLWRTHTGDFLPEGLQPVGKAHARAGEKCEGEGAAERN